LIEAQVAGVPVVAYATGGVAECLHPDISELCRRDQASDLEAGLSAMFRRVPSPGKLRSTANSVRRRFSRDAMIKQLEAIYRI
jgi:glycosyltransferase involved in cell wall biosynthesis